MVTLSAADAISPAVQRTRDFLFRPFRFGTYLRLCLVALLTEGIGNFQSSHHGGHTSNRVFGAASPSPFTPAEVAGIVAAALLATALAFIVFYLITRLRFAYFHCLVHNVRQIRPGWSIYRAQAMRFFGMNLVVGVCFLCLVLLAVLPFAAGLWAVVRGVGHGGRPEFGAILALALPLIPIIVLVVIAAIAVDVILRDFMLPHYALENATAEGAWRAVRLRIRAEKGPFLRYTLVRVFLPIVAIIGLGILFILPAILFAAMTAVIEFGIHSAVTGMAGIVLEVFVGATAFCVLAVVAISVGGPVNTAIREYALMFYGGRFPALGDILAPPIAPAGAPGLV